MNGRGGARLPGSTDESPDRIVLHVDMDCFYAACERLREPELAGEPVVVGMGYDDGERHGAVATASYEAREYGVESAMAIRTALDRLPRRATAGGRNDESREDESGEDDDEGTADGATGFYRPVDLEFYREVAADVKEILHDSADTVREVSIDEAYLDVTDRTAWEVAEGFARHVKNRIAREVGVAASVGVAPNMSAAKIASDFDKPDGLVVVEPGTVREFLAPLPVSEVHGVGPVTARELRDLDIETAGDLAAGDSAVLVERFGERGRELYERARGNDDREVTPRGRPKSLSRESAFVEATTDSDEKRERVAALADAVAERARGKGALYRTIGIKAVTPPFDVNTRARSLPGPVDDPALVREIALDLLTEFEDVPVRKVGVRVSNLSFATGEQTDLTGWKGASNSEPGSMATASTDGGAEKGSEAVSGTESESGPEPAKTESEAEDGEGDDGDGQASLADF